MNIAFITSIVGILKIAEIISSFFTWVLASSSGGFLNLGLGWVVFTGIAAFVVAIIFLTLYLFEIYPQIFADLRIEGYVSAIITVLHFISGIIAAVRASQYLGWGRGEAGASSFFAFVTMILFAIDTFLYFFMPTNGRPGTTAPPSTTTSDPDPNQPQNANVPAEYATANY